MKARALRRMRARRSGPELFLFERAFGDCLDRIATFERSFERALLIGWADAAWSSRLGKVAKSVEIMADDVHEDAWQPPAGAYDLVVAVGTLDTVNELPLAFSLLRHAMQPGGLFIGTLSGGNTLPRLRAAMLAADAVAGGAAPHVHPRIEPAALAPLLEQAGFERVVVDVDRVAVSYRTLDHLVRDLRGMGASNILGDRPRYVGRPGRNAATAAFAAAGDGERTVETFDLLHFAAWGGDVVKTR